jgi:hypothetical protein
MVTAYGLDCMVLWGRKAVGYVAPLHPPTLPPGANYSHGGKLRRMLTGTGVGSIFRFVNDLEWQPAWGPSPQSAWWRRAFRFRATLTRLTPAHKISPQAHSHADPNRARGRRVQTRQTHETFRPSLLSARPTRQPTNSKQVKPPWQSPPTPTHTNQLTTTQARLGPSVDAPSAPTAAHGRFFFPTAPQRSAEPKAGSIGGRRGGHG